MEKQFGNLSEFTDRDVELFRSTDFESTAYAFTEVDRDENPNPSAFVELLRFGFDGGDQQIYIRFPNTDYFVEMDGGGFGSSGNGMQESSGKNAFADKPYKMPFKIYSSGENLFYLSKDGGLSQFNFMKLVAEYNKGNKYDGVTGKCSVNIQEIEAALKFKYLKLPGDIRTVTYCYKTNGIAPKFFIVDYPAYKFEYTNHRLHVISGDIVSEYKITNFVRYRDGGTTVISVLDEDDKLHKLVFPSRLGGGSVKIDDVVYTEPVWDSTPLVEASKSEMETVVALLSLELEVEAED